MLPPGFLEAANLTESENQYFLRSQSLNGLDGYAFHYSIYRALTRFLGMDGNLAVAYDLDTNFITAWNEMFVNDDFLNPMTGLLDPKHMYGISNFDVFRWPSLENGTLRSALASFITYLVMPGVPLVGDILKFSFTRVLIFPRSIMARNRISMFTTPRHPIISMGACEFFLHRVFFLTLLSGVRQ